MGTVPPPIIDSAKLIYFAHNDADITFTDRISLYVGGSGEELEPIGEVPNLAITQPYYEPKDFLLMFCDSDWTVKGVIAFTSVEEAKIKAEKGYTGITSKWHDSSYSDEDIHDFLRDEYEVDPNSEWWASYCSFCGKESSDVNQMIKSQKAQICNYCIFAFYKELAENP
ncbi:MAG: ClpX C4-type zinc finger protein [Geobacteraceae bacterium]|nr:ClpX C4-type zinc finger protein [Geobacteraceae bacterium]